MNKVNFSLLEKQLKEKYETRNDPWGFSPEKAITDLKLLYPLYRYYFNVKLHGVENFDHSKNYMVISNHTGQIPIDALLICTAFFLELNPPIVLRPLVERFLSGLPFLGKWSSEGGAVLGDRQNCLNLLKREESLLVFPEGVRGIAKSSKNHYELQPFTKGFIRMALQTKTPILPIAVIGAEEFYPFVFHSKKLANFLRVPAIPLSLNLLPLPSPVDIYIGSPYQLPLELSPDSPDEEIEKHILNISDEVNSMIEQGLKNKRSFLKRN